ncbi:hypothetical protein M0R45_016670 [Rubus argutus]|uniref:Uncharacterized protein n=1 Tax=Rubus argutus TaxID=59490 RepID=A0AAW1XWS2_RUBAR
MSSPEAAGFSTVDEPSIEALDPITIETHVSAHLHCCIDHLRRLPQSATITDSNRRLSLLRSALQTSGPSLCYEEMKKKKKERAQLVAVSSSNYPDHGVDST